jgi:hypothetical protein
VVDASSMTTAAEAADRPGVAHNALVAASADAAAE